MRFFNKDFFFIFLFPSWVQIVTLV